MFRVHVLLYGDHVALARRCLDGIVASDGWSRIASLHVGCNAVGESTRGYLAGLAPQVPVPAFVYREAGGANVGKYTLMRRMLRGPEPGAIPDRVMWWDDDSYLGRARGLVSCEDDGPAWWDRVEVAAARYTLLGSVYTQRSTAGQREAIRRQPWYAGVPLPEGHLFRFATGGWWVADPLFLKRWDYPFPPLYHKGGDTLLGELCRQQRRPVRHFNDGVCINADADGRESRAARRGLSRSGNPLWRTYDPDVPDDLSHHRVDIRVGPLGEL